MSPFGVFLLGLVMAVIAGYAFWESIPHGDPSVSVISLLLALVGLGMAIGSVL
jgi:hypothetical protein